MNGNKFLEKSEGGALERFASSGDHQHRVKSTTFLFDENEDPLTSAMQFLLRCKTCPFSLGIDC
jgi:hypothetical protein